MQLDRGRVSEDGVLIVLIHKQRCVACQAGVLICLFPGEEVSPTGSESKMESEHGRLLHDMTDRLCKTFPLSTLDRSGVESWWMSPISSGERRTGARNAEWRDSWKLEGIQMVGKALLTLPVRWKGECAFGDKGRVCRGLDLCMGGC